MVSSPNEIQVTIPKSITLSIMEASCTETVFYNVPMLKMKVVGTAEQAGGNAITAWPKQRREIVTSFISFHIAKTKLEKITVPHIKRGTTISYKTGKEIREQFIAIVNDIKEKNNIPGIYLIRRLCNLINIRAEQVYRSMRHEKITTPENYTEEFVAQINAINGSDPLDLEYLFELDKVVDHYRYLNIKSNPRQLIQEKKILVWNLRA
jgi:hypothetical protein